MNILVTKSDNSSLVRDIEDKTDPNFDYLVVYV